MIEYRIDKTGGFAVVDHKRRIGSYAFPASTHADSAISYPEQAARDMIGAASGFQHKQENTYIECAKIVSDARS